MIMPHDPNIFSEEELNFGQHPDVQNDPTTDIVAPTADKGTVKAEEYEDLLDTQSPEMVGDAIDLSAIPGLPYIAVKQETNYTDDGPPKP